MILCSSLIKHLNVSCLFSQDTSGACPLRAYPATALLFYQPQAGNIGSLSPQNFILFKLNLHKNTLKLCTWKIYRHVILCIQKYTYYQWMFGKRGEGKGGKGADSLILTQRALRHAISPNYEERDRRGGEWDNPKNKNLSVENLEHFPKIHKLSRGAHFLGML